MQVLKLCSGAMQQVLGRARDRCNSKGTHQSTAYRTPRRAIPLDCTTSAYLVVLSQARRFVCAGALALVVCARSLFRRSLPPSAVLKVRDFTLEPGCTCRVSRWVAASLAEHRAVLGMAVATSWRTAPRRKDAWLQLRGPHETGYTHNIVAVTCGVCAGFNSKSISLEPVVVFKRCAKVFPCEHVLLGNACPLLHCVVSRCAAATCRIGRITASVLCCSCQKQPAHSLCA